MSQNLRLAIDIGGTFTDTVLADASGVILSSNKVLTSHDDPGRAALEGAVRALGDAGQTMEQVSSLIHGTTLATNALIENRGAQVVTIATEGFRDILEIAYERRYSQYDIGIEKPDLLSSQTKTLTVRERMDVHGAPLIALTTAAIDAVIADIDAIAPEAIAICLMHAYANSAHEDVLSAAISARFPDMRISLSSKVSPEAREFDRTCTTLANAYIQPLMDSYLSRFGRAFAQTGLAAPILMMTAAGGMCTLETARRFPIRLVESGPAGGAILAGQVARQAGLNEVLSFDMGGTTAKLCLIDDGQPQTARSFEVARAARFIKGSGMPVRIPVVDMIEIGAGGGSIAAVDRMGRLTVGPQSAGSDPGPAGFGRGGTHPTVTDADLAQGYIRPDRFAQGDFAPNVDASRAAISDHIGAKLELPADAAALGVSRIVDENMAAAARMHAVEAGKALGSRVMIAFGGNGPLHATRVARAAGVRDILIPPDPGVGSAVGFLYAPISFELVRSFYSRLGALNVADLQDLLAGMEDEARAVVAQGAPDAIATVRRAAFMRYTGQGHEIEISLPDGPVSHDWIPDLTAGFEAAYSDQFSRPVPGMEIEILNWSVNARVDLVTGKTADHVHENASKTGETVQITCDITGRMVPAECVDRHSLKPGETLQGPVLITEAQTTTLVSADFTAQLDAAGNLRLTRHSEKGMT